VAKQLTSGALEFVNRALGLFGKGSQETFLEDGNVQQLLEISRLAAASQALGPAQGFFDGTLRMIHIAAGDIREIMDPYSPGTRARELTGETLPFLFDIWFLFASATIVTGNTLTFDNLEMGLDPDGLFGISEGVTSETIMPLFRWNSQIGRVFTEAEETLVNSASGQSVFMPTPFLWPRGATIEVASQTSGAGGATINVKVAWAFVQRGLKPSIIS